MAQISSLLKGTWGLHIKFPVWNVWNAGILRDLAHAGLKHLNSLSLSGLQTLVFSPTLAHICRKLQHLDLDVKVPIEEVSRLLLPSLLLTPSWQQSRVKTL